MDLLSGHMIIFSLPSHWGWSEGRVTTSGNVFIHICAPATTDLPVSCMGVTETGREQKYCQWGVADKYKLFFFFFKAALEITFVTFF